LNALYVFKQSVSALVQLPLWRIVALSFYFSPNSKFAVNEFEVSHLWFNCAKVIVGLLAWK